MDDTNHATNTNANASSTTRERGEIAIKKSSAFDGGTILELASVVDMYGTGSDVVGRRSFGGFHKAVKNTWDAALKRRMDNDT